MQDAIAGLEKRRADDLLAHAQRIGLDDHAATRHDAQLQAFIGEPAEAEHEAGVITAPGHQAGQVDDGVDVGALIRGATEFHRLEAGFAARCRDSQGDVHASDCSNVETLVSADRHRGRRIELWVSGTEYEKLRQLARDLGMTSTGSSVSSVIRSAVNEYAAGVGAGRVLEAPASSRKYSRVRILEMRLEAERECRRHRRGTSS